jgi:hypothetical protein
MRHNEGNSTVLEAMYQSLTLKQRFKESLAEKYLKRKLWKLVGKVFVTWRSYVFRFILLRRRLLDTFEFNFLLNRFLSWRSIARRDALLRVMVKRHWRRVRIHAFRKFLRFNKEVMIAREIYYEKMNCFSRLQSYRVKCKRIRRRWHRFMYLQQAANLAVVLQKHFHRLQNKKIVQSRKRIKRAIMLSWLGLRLLKRRRDKENRRFKHESDTVASYQRKVELNLKFVLANDFSQENNMVLHNAYISSVNIALERSAKSSSFSLFRRQTEEEKGQETQIGCTGK